MCVSRLNVRILETFSSMLVKVSVSISIINTLLGEMTDNTTVRTREVKQTALCSFHITLLQNGPQNIFVTR